MVVVKFLTEEILLLKTFEILDKKRKFAIQKSLGGWYNKSSYSSARLNELDCLSLVSLSSVL
jgi:hypothetical protein